VAAVFLHWCLIRAILLATSYFAAAVSYERKMFVKSAPGNLAPDSGKRGGTGSWRFGARPGYRVAAAVAWPVWKKSKKSSKLFLARVQMLQWGETNPSNICICPTDICFAA
jgi:hypothetical protein